MKLNTKTRYGLRAIIEIGLNTTEQGVFQKDIAESQNISIKYLDQIIAELKSANLITTIGGKKSGYKLTKAAKDISVYKIFQAFNPPLQLIDCFESDTSCNKCATCAAKTFWCGLNAHIITYLNSKNLADLIEEQKKLNKQHDEMMFYI